MAKLFRLAARGTGFANAGLLRVKHEGALYTPRPFHRCPLAIWRLTASVNTEGEIN